MTTKTVTYKGWKLELDSAQIFPDDPGAGTPAMVISPKGSSATFGCALGTGECEYEQIPDGVYNWLESQAEMVDEFIEENSP